MARKREDTTRPEPLEYERCDVPEGMTLDEYRRGRVGDEPPERVWLRGWRRPKRRKEST